MLYPLWVASFILYMICSNAGIAQQSRPDSQATFVKACVDAVNHKVQAYPRCNQIGMREAEMLSATQMAYREKRNAQALVCRQVCDSNYKASLASTIATAPNKEEFRRQAIAACEARQKLPGNFHSLPAQSQQIHIERRDAIIGRCISEMASRLTRSQAQSVESGAQNVQRACYTECENDADKASAEKYIADMASKCGELKDSPLFEIARFSTPTRVCSCVYDAAESGTGNGIDLLRGYTAMVEGLSEKRPMPYTGKGPTPEFMAEVGPMTALATGRFMSEYMNCAMR